MNPPHAQKSPWWCTKSTGKPRYPSHKIRAPACISWDMLLSCCCQRTEIPTGKAIHPFSSAINSMFDPFQHLSSQEFQTVTSFCCVALPVRWYWCKYVQRQEGALQNPAGVSEDETLQPLPSSSPEHSPSDTATAGKGGMQRLPCTNNILLCISSILQFQAHLFFQSFQVLIFKKSSSPVRVFFFTFPFWFNRHRLSLTGESLETTDPFSSTMKMDGSFVKS